MIRRPMLESIGTREPQRLAQLRQRREPVLKGALKCKSEQRLSAKY